MIFNMVPQTLAVVLNPASGLEKAESRKQKVPRHCEERSNPGIQEVIRKEKNAGLLRFSQ
jgi:hypothetical protein